jgi:hypothetical protein
MALKGRLAVYGYGVGALRIITVKRMNLCRRSFHYVSTG